MLSQLPSKRWLIPLKPPLFPFIAEHDFTWYGITLWLVQVICPVASCPNPLHSPNLFTGRAEWETEMALMLCKHCSAKARTLMCYQYCFGHKSKTQHHMSCCEEKELHRSHAQYSIYLHTHIYTVIVRLYLQSQWVERKILSAWIRLMLVKDTQRGCISLLPVEFWYVT